MRFCIFVPLILFMSNNAYSQGSLPRDSIISHPDTLAGDTLRVRQDTTSSVKGIDTLVTYTCTDSIVYSMSTKRMSLYNKSDIKYQQIGLQAERIDINWNTSVMTAHGVPDSSGDSTQKKFKGLPVMKDGGEEFHGFELGYNFKTKKGKIDLGDTKIDQGYYHGEDIKKVEPDVLFVADGRYTTCDAPEPHYYFGSPKMKVILRDKVIAQPVYLYIADVPLFALPLGVFPNKGGRRSGIIAPAIVEDATHGRLLHHLGYYWAISDYMDMNLRSDLYTKGSWALYSDYRYNLRYEFNGSLSGQYKKLTSGEASDPKRTQDESYQLNFFHNQVIDPTTRLNVNFTFASNNSYLNTIDQRQLLNQTITSNATLSKTWEGTPNSISINVARTQYLQTGNINETLPSISFNHSQSYPFRFGTSISDVTDAAWYENIGFSYGATLANNRAKISRTIDGIRVNDGGAVTFQSAGEFERDRSQTINQNMSLNIAPKLGYVTISPFLSYSDGRSFSDNDVPQRSLVDSTLTFGNVKASHREGFISSGVSMSTKVYGIVQPGLFGVEAIRHALTPNLSLTYRKQIIGESLAPKQMLLGFNVGNVFEMKTKPPEEGKEGSKIQLLNLSAGISYDFSADSLNLSAIGVSYRTAIGDLLSIAGGASFDLYKLEQTGPLSYNRVNKLLIREEGRLARLTAFSIDLSTTLAGEKSTSRAHENEADTSALRRPRNSYYGVYRDEEPDFSIPWRLSLTLNYSESKVPPFPARNSGIRGDLEFNLTENWKFSMSGGYDIVNKEVVVPNIAISRDLHCWLMNFSWVPLGLARSYQFEIRVKAPQMRDIKITKQGSERGYYSY